MEPSELARNFPLDSSQPELGMIDHPLAVQALERAFSRLLRVSGDRVVVPVSREEASALAGASRKNTTDACCWLAVGVIPEGEAVYVLTYSTEPDGHKDALRIFLENCRACREQSRVYICP